LSKTVGSRTRRKYSCISAHRKKEGRGFLFGGGGAKKRIMKRENERKRKKTGKIEEKKGRIQ
jgi:hypothetical protein